MPEAKIELNAELALLRNRKKFLRNWGISVKKWKMVTINLLTSQRTILIQAASASIQCQLLSNSKLQSKIAPINSTLSRLKFCRCQRKKDKSKVKRKPYR